MKEIIIDFNKYSDVEAFHEDIAQMLDFPDYYGENLDALHDMIESIPEDMVQFTVIHGGAISEKQQMIIERILSRE